MLSFLARRLVLTLVVLLGVATLVFSLIHLVPGDPAQAMLGEGAAPEDIAQLRARLGLDRPLIEQYAAYMRGLAQGDLGVSLRTQQPVTQQIAERVPATAELAGAAMLVAVALALPLGVIAAVWRGTWVDQSAMALALAGISVPGFWLGPLLALVFAVELGWLPVSGRGTAAHLVLPAVTLGAALAAILARMTRASVLEELRGTRAGREPREGGAGARAAKQPDPGGHDPRPATGRRADRVDHHRDDLLVAGRRTTADSVDQLSRLPDGAGLHPAHRGDLRGDEPAHRRGVRVARSTNPGALMARIAAGDR
jgi:hypothetical protein